MLNQAVRKYIKKKEHQRMKPITSNCETSLRQENEELCISKQVLEKKIEELLDLQEQYKSREVAMTRSLEIGRAHAELQSPMYLVCRLLLEKKKTKKNCVTYSNIIIIRITSKLTQLSVLNNT